VNKQTLYEKIYSDLVREIQNGNYKIGMQVPTEKELSQKYKVSRITSKKALDKLAEQGIINRIPGKGSFVENTNIQSAYSNNKDDKERILIGVIMDGFGASFGCGVLQGIIQECRTYNMDFILRSSHGSKEIETQAINDLIALGVEGIIIMCVHDENYNATILKHVIEGFPIVSVDRRMKGVPISYVGTDNKKAAKDLTNILLDKKFESICFVSHMRMDTSTISDRKTGFIESHLEHNLTTASSLWITDLKSTLPSCYSEEAVHEDIAKVRNFIQKHNQIQAFFALEYEIARIIYKVLVELELEKERPIVCFDGVGNIVNDILFTHIKQDENVIGARSVALLADKIKGDSKVETVLVPHKILFSNEFTNIGPQ
jgi:GntR family transcriptional regulator, arabinose operon transcriptional repressor